MEHHLSPQQLADLRELRDKLDEAPARFEEIVAAGRDYYAALISQPEWTVGESPKPHGPTPAPTWQIGPPKIRYFDSKGNETPQP